MRTFTKEQEEWIATRPPVIQAMIRATPPGQIYRLKATDQRVTIAAYSEDGTVRVDVTEALNGPLMFERSVFGIDPADLEPITPEANP